MVCEKQLCGSIKLYVSYDSATANQVTLTFPHTNIDHKYVQYHLLLQYL